MGEDKVSKKKQKALSFRKSKEEREQEKQKKAEKERAKEEAQQQKRKLEEEASTPKKEESSTTTEDGEPAPKKRKTRRGKKGKGVNNGKGPRFILFVGNLPYDTQQPELEAHFKNAKPDRIRIRREKGIAFLEFDNDNQEIQNRMGLALKMHHSTLRERKINVELTVGGGGNSENRQSKLKEKNEKLKVERKENIKKEEAKKDKGKKTETVSGMHPARAALLKQSS